MFRGSFSENTQKFAFLEEERGGKKSLSEHRNIPSWKSHENFHKNQHKSVYEELKTAKWNAASNDEL